MNSGEVSGQYRLYWKTWDGQYIYDDVWRNLNDDYMQNGGKIFIRDVYDPFTGKYMHTEYDNWEFSGLSDWEFKVSKYALMTGVDRRKELDKIKSTVVYPLYYGDLTDGQLSHTEKVYETKVLEGYVDTSKLSTEGGRILSGGNLTLDVKELVNKKPQNGRGS